MIALLRGKIELITEKFVILDVGGVGYKVFCSSQTLKELVKKPTRAATGQAAKETKLFIHLHTREGILDLYGFLSLEELELFEQLISVSGVGPKVGLSVMALAAVRTLKQAIASLSPQAAYEWGQDIIKIDLRSDLRRVDVPVQIIIGKKDPYLSLPSVYRMASLFKDAEVEVVRRGDHEMTIKNPEIIAAKLVDFLTFP